MSNVNPFSIADDDGDDNWGDDWGDDYDNYNDDDGDEMDAEYGEQSVGLVDRDHYGYSQNNNESRRESFQIESSNHNRRRRNHSWSDSNSSNNNESKISSSIYLPVAIVLVLIFLSVSLSASDNDGNDNNNNNSPKSLKDVQSTQHLVIIGERHSGVPWMLTKLNECYPNAYISTSLQRIGYFFQDDETSQLHNSIVLHASLDIYDWLEQMRQQPEYMPRHVESVDSETGYITPLDWPTFLQTPWALEERPARDLPFQNHTGPVCQLEFSYDRVMSCVQDRKGFGLDNPIYELQEDGSPFPSILELRAAKLYNHLAVSEWKTVRRVIPVQYHQLGSQDYFETAVLEKIEQVAPHFQRHCASKILPPSLSKTSEMSLDFVQYINAHANWDAEALVGYEAWNEADIESLRLPSKPVPASNTTIDDEEEPLGSEEPGAQDATGEEEVLESSDDSEDEDLAGNHTNLP